MLNLARETSTLLVMDFQNDIVDLKGSFGKGGIATHITEQRAVENTVKAIAAARSKGFPVVYVRVAFRPGHPEISGAVPLFTTIKEANALVEGTWGADFHPDVAPGDGELIITKRGISALAGTDLHQILHGRGISTLVLAGIATNFVVEGTARHAADLGYGVVVISDCCATFTYEMHTFAITSVLPQLATIATVNEFVEALGGN